MVKGSFLKNLIKFSLSSTRKQDVKSCSFTRMNSFLQKHLHTNYFKTISIIFWYKYELLK